MNKWKSTKKPPKHDVWVSEVRLKKTDNKRTGLAKKLFRLIGEEDASIS